MRLNQPLINAFNSLRKREGKVLALLKIFFFESQKKLYTFKKVRDLLVEHKGGSWGSEDFANSIKAKVLRSPDIRFESIDFEKAEERFFTAKEIENFKLKDNDILVIKSNGSLDLVGKSQIFKSNPAFPQVIASNFLMILRPDEQKVYPEYLDLFLKSPQALVWRFDKKKTTTGLRNLNSKDYLSLEVPIPNDTEAQKELFNRFQRFTQGKFEIGDEHYKNAFLFGRANETLTAELNHQLALVKELRQAYLREAMQGKLVAQDEADEPAHILLERIKAEKQKLIAEKRIKREKPLPPIKAEEIPFEIPANWTWCRLGEICTSFLGGFSFLSTDFNTSGNNQVLRLGNVKNDLILFESSPVFISDVVANQTPAAALQVHDLLITMTGTRAKRDYCFTKLLDEKDFNGRKRLFLNQRVGCFRFSLDIVTGYIVKVLKLSAILEPVFKSATGTANQANIGKEALLKILIPLPPLAEQERIVAKLEKLTKYCDELETNIKQGIANADLLLQVALKEALQP